MAPRGTLSGKSYLNVTQSAVWATEDGGAGCGNSTPIRLALVNETTSVLMGRLQWAQSTSTNTHSS